MATAVRRGPFGSRRFGDDAGVALLELALVLPVLAVLVFGAIDLGRAFALKNAVTNMAREGALRAFVSPCPLDDVEDAVRAENDELGDQVEIRVVVGTDPSGPPATCPSGGFPKGTELTIVVVDRMDILAPFVSEFTGNPVDVTGTATVKLSEEEPVVVP
jgi:hypothetical protein